MIATFMNAVAVLFVLVLLVVFVQGVWRHTVEQTLDDTILADPSPHAKTKRYFRLLGKVLWNVAVPIVMVGAVLIEFMGLMAEAKNDEPGINTSDDFRYKHDGERYYTHSTPGDSKASWY